MSFLSDLQQVSRISGDILGQGRLRVETDQNGKLIGTFTAKSRFGHWDITGRKARSAKKALSDYLEAGVNSAKLCKSTEFQKLKQSLNTRHALRPKEVQELLSNVFEAVGQSKIEQANFAGKLKGADCRHAVSKLDLKSPPRTPARMQELFTNHTDAVLTEAFWNNEKVKTDIPSIGCRIALAIVNRICTNRVINETDLRQLNVVLDPECRDNGGKINIQLDKSGKAKLSTENLLKILAGVFEAYVGEKAKYEINLSDDGLVSLKHENLSERPQEEKISLVELGQTMLQKGDRVSAERFLQGLQDGITFSFKGFCELETDVIIAANAGREANLAKQ